MKKAPVIFFIISVFLCLGFFTFFTYGNEASEGGGQKNLFVVNVGETYSEIIERLKNDGYISSETIFKVVFSFMSSQEDIKPGGYMLEKNSSIKKLIIDISTPTQVWVSIPEKFSKRDMAQKIMEALSWDKIEERQFVTAYTSIQWDALNGELIELFGKKFVWADTEKETFATMGAFFSDTEYDFMENYYVPKNYLVSKDISRAQFAHRLVSEFKEEYKHSLSQVLQEKLSEEKALNIKNLVKGEVELLPDLVPLPPYDVFLENQGGKDVLLFTTTYWNEGRGAFELQADEKTRGVTGDVERGVFQRIYRIDGDYRSKLVGTFLWHDIHLHYHFNDFVDYVLTRIDDVGNEVINTKKKATFCVRDIDPISLEIDGAGSEPGYRICGKERQGVSVGWGDSYYYTYADQNIDVSGLPAGVYVLSFVVNPQGLFEESSYENNIAELLMKIDVSNDILEIIN